MKEIKKIVFETFKQILNEEVNNLNEFIETLKNKHNISEELEEEIKSTIKQSGCQKIEFLDAAKFMGGLSLHDGVVINYKELTELNKCLFIIFHELAHQYQFKKYGIDKMYSCYKDDISNKDAALFMLNAEKVADQFANRKMSKLKNMGLISADFNLINDNRISIHDVERLLERIKQGLKHKNVDLNSHEKISEYFYNMIKNSL